ncbi:LuxR C-terminal-related transcriptional regulator [Crossiella sp. CA-258035]|uniref:helix-turn-helix transcriptional regulator n=1 Tax=Crossiella sp. CA-258035 TaxID=2981138 RepID=UPI0024BCF58F|nr:LuxR C-terminal-related transcriptional regulator [Crossiella sp. CA-258035]WHT23675.1 LuxR C-terminal-related transcriptional regulator [Crossiella sp. CA-258035]
MRVAVYAPDPLTAAGLTGTLRACADMVVEEGLQSPRADVRVVVADALTSELLSLLRRAANNGGVPVVLVVNQLEESELLAAVECRVVAVLPRAAATGDRLVHGVRAAAAGGGVLPPVMLGELLKHVERLQRELLAPKGMNAAGLSPREVDVLRLMADGWDTAEIATRLCYSERTVKNVISGVTQRLKLKNRPHAVAYAMRAGMI